MKDCSWINHPAMRNIDARKMKVIVNLLNDVEGKPLEIAVPGIMKANEELKKQGLYFTSQEQSLILDIISKDLTPAQKQKFDMVKSMMNLHNF